MKETLLILPLLMGACTSNTEEFSDKVVVNEMVSLDEKSAVSKEGLVGYQDDNGEQKVQYFTCRGSFKSDDSVLVVNPQHESFKAEDFCAGWKAQIFLNNGLNVLGVNRPGHGGSTGSEDLGGENSRRAIRAVLEELKGKSIVGAWSTGAGAVALMFLAKEDSLPWWLIIGNGIYDLEETVEGSSDETFKSFVASLVEAEGDGAFDSRSIAWDSAGVPEYLMIYHGETNQLVAADQARSFRDAVASQGSKVDLKLVAKAGLQIPEAVEQSLIAGYLKALK